MEKPLIDRKYLLQRFEGKGGWTYAEIPEILQNKNNPFGWVKVKGFIDGAELKQYNLMPMGNGRLFLPVKAEIRKKIGKEAGDFVHVILFPDDSPYTIPGEIAECFQQESPEVSEFFSGLSEGEQKAYINWIYEAKTLETKTVRIVKMMDRLVRKLKFQDTE